MNLSTARTTLLRVLPAALLLSLVAGCATRTANPLEGSSRSSDQIEILVQNQNFNQVTVYTLRSGSYRRLGIVQGKSDGAFKTDWSFPDMQLRVKFLSGPDLVTPSEPVFPGDILELIIPAR